MQNQLLFTSNTMQEKKLNTILRPSPFEELYDIGPSINTTNPSTFQESTQAQLETKQIMMDVPDVNFRCTQYEINSALTKTTRVHM